jgi:hypothetical protein
MTRNTHPKVRFEIEGGNDSAVPFFARSETQLRFAGTASYSAQFNRLPVDP